MSPETQRWVAKPSSQSLHAVSPGIATRKQDAILSEAQHVFSILNLPLQALIPAVVLADGYRTPVTLISQTPTLSKSLITPYPIHTHNTYQQISRPSRPPSLRLGLPSPGQIPRIPRIPSVSFVVRHDIMALTTCLTRCHGCVALLQICHGGKDLGKNWLINKTIMDHRRLQICTWINPNPLSVNRCASMALMQLTNTKVNGIRPFELLLPGSIYRFLQQTWKALQTKTHETQGRSLMNLYI